MSRSRLVLSLLDDHERGASRVFRADVIGILVRPESVPIVVSLGAEGRVARGAFSLNRIEQYQDGVHLTTTSVSVLTEAQHERVLAGEVVELGGTSGAWVVALEAPERPAGLASGWA